MSTSELEVNHLRMEVQVLRAELATLRPAAEALKTAVDLRIYLSFTYDAGRNSYARYADVVESDGTDPLAATIKAIQRAAEAVKDNGK